MILGLTISFNQHPEVECHAIPDERSAAFFAMGLAQQSDDLVAMGSEEIAIRSVLPQEIDTYDPFDGEVKVWQI